MISPAQARCRHLDDRPPLIRVLDLALAHAAAAAAVMVAVAGAAASSDTGDPLHVRRGTVGADVARSAPPHQAGARPQSLHAAIL